MKQVYFTVTNDLSFDQRMQRICSSLAQNGYKVTLIGRRLKSSLPLIDTPFQQYRIKCIFNKGMLFYTEYNIRLFFYLLLKKQDAICAIDLDTILPCLMVSRIKSIPRIYDAHELFCEMKEVVSRPRIYHFWKSLEKITVPKFEKGYTVNASIKDIFKKEYGVDYSIIRNVPFLQGKKEVAASGQFIIYQGAVNEGRSFETLIPAFQYINCPLHIYGDGNFFEKAMALTKQYGLEQKIIFKGKALPAQLKEITPQAALGITLFENNGLSNYYSLANRFFDYIHAGIPQLCVNYPAYKEVNDHYNVAFLINDLSPNSIATAINNLLNNKEQIEQLKTNCIIARQQLNWQNEEKILLQFYNDLFQK